MTELHLDRRALLAVAVALPALAAGSALAQPGAPVTVIAEITTEPQDAEAFRAKFIPFAAAVRTEPGCLHYTVLEDDQTPGHFFTYEMWADKAAIEAHMQAPAIKALGAQAGAMLAKPPSQAVLHVVSAS